MAAGGSRSSSNGDTQVVGTTATSSGSTRTHKNLSEKSDKGRTDYARRDVKSSAKVQQSNGCDASTGDEKLADENALCNEYGEVVSQPEIEIKVKQNGNQTEDTSASPHDEILEAEKLVHQQAMNTHAEEYGTLKERLFQTRLAKVQVMLEELREGKLQRFVNQKARLEEQAIKQLEAAKVRKHYQVTTLDHHCEYTIKNAHEDYEDRVKTLKQKMIADLEENLRQINTAKLEMDTPTSPSLPVQLTGSEKHGGKRSQSRNKSKTRRLSNSTMSSPSAGDMPYPGMSMGRHSGSPYHGTSPNTNGNYHPQHMPAHMIAQGSAGSMHGMHSGAAQPQHLSSHVGQQVYHIASHPKKRRRTPTITMQPYVVYMLSDREIGDDLSRLHSAYVHAVAAGSGGMVGLHHMNPHGALIANGGHPTHV